MGEVPGWITVEDYCEQTGEKAATIHKRVFDGVWQRGVHFSVPEPRGAGYINVAAAKAWKDSRSKVQSDT
jgi:hypothetical protein